MKKILLIGDSICMNYREYVLKYLPQELLEKYEVIYPYENGKMSSHLYRMLYEWKNELNLNADNVAVVYWNCGLWDVVHIYGDNAQTPIEEYEHYIKRIHNRLTQLFPSAVIIFATTTPIVEDRYKPDFTRYNKEIEEYNDVAKRTLGGIEQIDDLYLEVDKLGVVSSDYVDVTHFDVELSKKLAEHIAGYICGKVQDDIKNITISEMQQRGMENARSIMESTDAIVLWGAGKRCRQFCKLLKSEFDIYRIVDSDSQKKGSCIEGIQCIEPSEFMSEKKRNIVIMVDSYEAQMEIWQWCFSKDMLICSYKDIMNVLLPQFEKEKIKDYAFKDFPLSTTTMKKYIGINVPAYGCNFDCCYCYLKNKMRGKEAFPKLYHLPEYIRYRLRRENIGGSALIGICAYGETLLADGVVDVCIELLKEGHYLHIVTNAISTKKIEEILDRAGAYASHIIFKVSFHYLELKRRNLFATFVENIHIIDKSKASFTLELMPHDEIIPLIPEILEFSKDNFGAYPQLTIGRDECNNRKLLTALSVDEYIKIWSVFKSEMFSLRMKLYMMRGRNCAAGKNAFFFDLYSGGVDRCVFDEDIDNIYDDNFIAEYKAVGDLCPLDYCFNCHVYATLGLMPGVDAPTYMKIRDRVREDGTHWIKDDMRRFLDVKLYDTVEGNIYE